ncbi:MAG: mechanosensitive ion channel family protein [Gemmatimonadetes bacterium]|nr:mechanosensitive ion channel family protein [Gemmatimonadota bacterium]
MEFLRQNIYGNPLSAWLTALAAAVAGFVATRLVTRQLIRGIARLAQRTDTALDDLVTVLLKATQGFLFLLLAIYLGALILVLPAAVEGLLRKAVIVGLFVQGAIWGNAAITFLVRRHGRRELPEDPAAVTTLNALGFVARLVLWSLILLLALDNLGIDVTALVTGLGIGGVAVALAVQNILGDLFASLSIVLDRPFVLGDFIVVGNLMGTVEHIGLKTTRVRALSGEQLVFSNSDLLASRIRNFRRMHERRVVFTFGVVYATPAERLARVPGMVREIVEAQERTRFDRAHFKELADSSLNFEVVYYVLVPEYNVYMDVQQAINLALIRRCAAEGIEFAYPTQTVYVHRQSMPGTASAVGSA